MKFTIATALFLTAITTQAKCPALQGRYDCTAFTNEYADFSEISQTVTRQNNFYEISKDYTYFADGREHLIDSDASPLTERKYIATCNADDSLSISETFNPDKFYATHISINARLDSQKNLVLVESLDDKKSGNFANITQTCFVNHNR